MIDSSNDSDLNLLFILMSLALAGVVAPLYERNQEATIYIGSLDAKVTDDVVWELFTQCGPVVNVHVPKDKITGEH